MMGAEVGSMADFLCLMVAGSYQLIDHSIGLLAESRWIITSSGGVDLFFQPVA
jgi:hypothetical protein